MQNIFLYVSERIKKIPPMYQGKLFLLTVILLFLTIIANLPYFNILLTVSNIIWIMILLSLFAFHISMRNILLTAVLLLIIALISVLIGNMDLAEILGNAIYLMIIIVFVSEIIGYLREIKR